MAVCELHDGMVERIQRCEADIKLLQNQDNDINVRQARMETKLDYITKEVQALIIRIDIIIAQPGKRWENVITILVTSGIVGLITFFFSRGGQIVG